jgi:uncharacterized protein YdeI (YjbR/CyaY-like superfamily)
MGARDKRVDTYIARAAEFARPVLVHIRDIVHEACPEVEEQIKWGCPHFSFKGLMCSMAAFRSHCAMGFTKSSLLPDPEGIFEKRGTTTAWGQLGRITRLVDLPADAILLEYVKRAAALNDAGIKRPRRAARAVGPLRIPIFFSAALKKQPPAWKIFGSFSVSQKRDYVEWLTEAKSEETKQKRLDMAVEWIAAGKTRNWKYLKKKKRPK